jgi:lysozyme family protein
MNPKLWAILNFIDDLLIPIFKRIKRKRQKKKLSESQVDDIMNQVKGLVKKEGTMAVWDLAITQILENEGGYQDNGADKGNYNSLNQMVGTNYGISAPVLESYLGYPPMAADSLNLTIDQAKDIYRQKFWNQNELDQIKDPATAIHLMDLFVNHGGYRAPIIVHEALDSMGYTNYGGSGWGSMTRSEINRIHQDGKSAMLNQRIVKFRKEFYQHLVDLDSTQSVFLKGWLKRAEKFNQAVIVAGGSGIAALLIAAGVYYYSK